MEVPSSYQDTMKEEGELSDDCEIIEEPPLHSQKLGGAPNAIRDGSRPFHSRSRRYNRPRATAKSKRVGKNSFQSRNKSNNKNWTQSRRYHSPNYHHRDTQDTPQSRSGFWDRTRAAGHYLRLRGLSLREKASFNADNQIAALRSPTLDDAITCEYSDGDAQELKEIVAPVTEESGRQNEDTNKYALSLPKPVKPPPSPPTDMQESDYIHLLLEYKQIQSQLEMLRKEEATRGSTHLHEDVAQPRTTPSQPELSSASNLAAIDLPPEGLPLQAETRPAQDDTTPHPAPPDGSLQQQATVPSQDKGISDTGVVGSGDGECTTPVLLPPAGGPGEEDEDLDVLELRRAALGSMAQKTAQLLVLAVQDRQGTEHQSSSPHKSPINPSANLPSQKETRQPSLTKTVSSHNASASSRDSRRSSTNQKRPSQQGPTTSRKRLNSGSRSRRTERRRPNPPRKSDQQKVKAGETRRREIHRILALDDHEEQVERFVRMMAGKAASSGGPSLNKGARGARPLPQDNYEEVEMDIDSEPSSPVTGIETGLVDPMAIPAAYDGTQDMVLGQRLGRMHGSSPYVPPVFGLLGSEMPPHIPGLDGPPFMPAYDGTSHSPYDINAFNVFHQHSPPHTYENFLPSFREAQMPPGICDYERLPPPPPPPPPPLPPPLPEDCAPLPPSEEMAPIGVLEVEDETHHLRKQLLEDLIQRRRDQLDGPQYDSHSPTTSSPAHSSPLEVTAQYQVEYSRTLQPVPVDYTATLQPVPVDYTGTLQPVPVDYTGTLQPIPVDYTETLQPVPVDYTGTLQPVPADYTGTLQPVPVETTVTLSPIADDTEMCLPPPAADRGAALPPVADIAAAGWPATSPMDSRPYQEADIPRALHLKSMSSHLVPKHAVPPALYSSQEDNNKLVAEPEDVTMAAGAVINIEPLQLEEHLPLHKPVVISLGASSGSDTEPEEDPRSVHNPPAKFGGALDQFLKAQRQSVESKEGLAVPEDDSSGMGSPQQITAATDNQTALLQARLKTLASQWNKTKLGVERHQLQLKSLKSAATKRQASLSVVEQRAQQLREQAAAAERMMLATQQQVHHFNSQVERVQATMQEKQHHLSVLERQACAAAKELYGDQLVNTQQLLRKKNFLLPVTDIHSAKQQLKERERKIAEKIRELKEHMQQPSGTGKVSQSKTRKNKKVSWHKSRTRHQNLEKISLCSGPDDEREVTVLTPHRRRSLADLSPSTRPNLVLTKADSGQRSVRQAASDLLVGLTPSRSSVESRLGPSVSDSVRPAPGKPSPQRAWESPSRKSGVSSEEEGHLVVTNSPRSKRVQCSGKLTSRTQPQVTLRSQDMPRKGSSPSRQVHLVLDKYNSEPAARGSAVLSDHQRSPLTIVKSTSRSRSLTPDRPLNKPPAGEVLEPLEPAALMQPSAAHLDALRKSLIQSKVPASARHLDLAVRYNWTWIKPHATPLPAGNVATPLVQSNSLPPIQSHGAPLYYRSGLLRFRSYRFQPYFRTQARMSLLSPSVAHRIEVNRLLCRFDLHGTCNDEKCPWQHCRDYSLSPWEQLLDLSCYCPNMTDVQPKASTAHALHRLGTFVSEFQEKNQVISHDKQCLLLSSQVSYAAGKAAPHLMFLEGRRYRPQQSHRVYNITREDGSFILPTQTESSEPVFDDNTLSESDIRYWMLSDGELQDMETGVLENPHDIQLWFKLAGKRLQDSSSGHSQGLEQALHTLSRALEANRGREELWLYYLRLYEQHKGPDLLELCQQALHFAPSYYLHWRYIQLLPSSSLKHAAAEELLAWLCHTAPGGQARDSHRLLEVLFFQVALHVSCGRYRSALTVFGNALRNQGPSSLSSLLTAPDLCLAWLAYIQLTECRFLPPSMYDPSNANPGRINSKAAFLLPLEGKSRTSMVVLRQLLREAIASVCEREKTLKLDQSQVHSPSLAGPRVDNRQQTCTSETSHSTKPQDTVAPEETSVEHHSSVEGSTASPVELERGGVGAPQILQDPPSAASPPGLEVERVGLSQPVGKPLVTVVDTRNRDSPMSVMDTVDSLVPGKAVSVMDSEESLVPGKAVSVMDSLVPGKAVSVMDSEDSLVPGKAVSVMDSLVPGKAVSVMDSEDSLVPGKAVSVMDSLVPGKAVSVMDSEDSLVLPGKAVSLMDSLVLGKVVSVMDTVDSPYNPTDINICASVQTSSPSAVSLPTTIDDVSPCSLAMLPEDQPHVVQSDEVAFLAEVAIGNNHVQDPGPSVIPQTAVKSDTMENLPLIASALPLYRNWAHLEVHNDNHAAALEVCEEVLKVFPSCVEVWLQMADMKQSPEETVKMLDSAVEAYTQSPQLYHALALAHLAQGDDDGALQHLEDAALCFMQNAHEDPLPDPNYLYCHLLGQPVPLSFQCPPLVSSLEYIDRQQPFLWINYCLLVELQGNVAEAADIFETALSVVRDTQHIHAIWRSYLHRQIQLLQSGSSSVSLAAVVELLQRALLTLPSRVPLPHGNGRCWVDYTLHCDLLALLVNILPMEQTALLYEKLLPQMPNNVIIIQMCCELALSEGHRTKARGISAAAVRDNPRCLTLWKIHLALMHRDSSYSEVQKLYRHALHHLPYALTLWKDYLAYEFVQGTPAGAQRIIERCRQLHLNIDDFLNGLKRPSGSKPQPGLTRGPVVGAIQSQQSTDYSSGRPRPRVTSVSTVAAKTSSLPTTVTSRSVSLSSRHPARVSTVPPASESPTPHGARTSRGRSSYPRPAARPGKKAVSSVNPLRITTSKNQATRHISFVRR